MNGVLQFSVLDGYSRVERATRRAPAGRCRWNGPSPTSGSGDELDAEMIYNTIEEQIVPLYKR